MSDISLETLGSLRQALAISTMRKSMNQDAGTAAALIEGLQQASAAVMEHSVTPHKGGSIDVSV